MLIQNIYLENLNMPRQECVLSPKDASVYDILEDYSDNGYIYNAEEIRN